MAKNAEKAPRPSGPTLKYMSKRILTEFLRDQGMDQAAKLTYFMVLSIAPTLLALFSLATLLLSDMQDEIADLIKEAVASGGGSEVGPAVDSTLDSLMGSTGGGTAALIIGIGTALWSASAYIKAFGRVTNDIYEIKEGRGFVPLTVTMLALTLAMILGILLIMVSLMLNQTIVDGILAPIAGPLGATGLVSFLSGTFLPFWAWLKWPVILVIAFALVSLLYWGAPNITKPFRFISPGGVFAILGIILAAGALSIYMATVASYSSYGAIGGVMAVLFALWVMNIVIILGAEVDAEYQRATELESGRPAEDTLTAAVRDDSASKTADEKYAKVVDEGRDIRLRHLHRDRDAYVAEENRLTPRAEDADAADGATAKATTTDDSGPRPDGQR